MVRQEWTAIAKVVGDYRSKIEANRPVLHNRHGGQGLTTYWAAQLATIDEIVNLLVRFFKRRSSRFDEKRFRSLCKG